VLVLIFNNILLNNNNNQIHDASDIAGVSLATVGELFIEVENTESLRIEAEDNLIPLIRTDVRNGV
jgi:hypothetical protein